MYQLDLDTLFLTCKIMDFESFESLAASNADMRQKTDLLRADLYRHYLNRDFGLNVPEGMDPQSCYVMTRQLDSKNFFINILYGQYDEYYCQMQYIKCPISQTKQQISEFLVRFIENLIDSGVWDPFQEHICISIQDVSKQSNFCVAQNHTTSSVPFGSYEPDEYTIFLLGHLQQMLNYLKGGSWNGKDSYNLDALDSWEIEI